MKLLWKLARHMPVHMSTVLILPWHRQSRDVRVDSSGVLNEICWFTTKCGNSDQTNGKCSFHEAKYTLHCDSYVGMCFLSPSLGGEGINRFLCVSRLHQHLHWHVPGFFWTSWRVLTKLMCVYTIKSWLSLYDPDLFFKVTLGLKLPNLSEIMTPPNHLMNCEWNLYECI